MTTPIRVFIVDSSPIVCRLLATYLQAADDITVIGAAYDGQSSLAQIRKQQPDVVTLGLEMGGMSGLDILQQIMHDVPTPVVVISGVSRRSAQLSIKAIDAGAVDFILKYTPQTGMNPNSLRQEIVAKVRAAAKVRVVRSVRSRVEQASPSQDAEPEHGHTTQAATSTFAIEDHLPGGVVVIGASTGGPVALRELLNQLPAGFPAAILVVQHMPATFTRVLAAQLNHQIPLQVREAQAGDRLQAGEVLVVPGDYHLLVQSNAEVTLNQAPKIMGHRPSIDVTMQSVAQVVGRHTIGIVLTGMGEDGMLGLVAIQSKGGKTYAQDSASCVVDGMPQRARERGVVDVVARPTEIGLQLKQDLTLKGWPLLAEAPTFVTNP